MYRFRITRNVSDISNNTFRDRCKKKVLEVQCLEFKLSLGLCCVFVFFTPLLHFLGETSKPEGNLRFRGSTASTALCWRVMRSYGTGNKRR